MQGIWKALKALINTIQGVGTFVAGILVILGLVLVIKFANRTVELPGVPNGSVLVLWPEGNVVEQAQYPNRLSLLFNSFDQQPPETSVHDILTAIERGKNDSRIAAMAILTDNMWGVSPAHGHEIAEAVRSFREAGKEVYAISSEYDQASYLIAAEATKVFLNPAGSLLLTGYGQYVPHFKQLLDKVGATVNVFRVGTYKSAVEPYLRDDMSEAAKTANRAFLGSLWESYESSVTRARGLEAGALSRLLADFSNVLRAGGGNFAQAALDQGLVDALAPRSEWRNELMEKYGTTPDGVSFNQIHYQAYLGATQNMAKRGEKAIAVITAQGEIVMGDGPINVAAAETLVRHIREARTDENVAAIVLRVDSPGGSAFASELIRQELAAAQADGIPVISSFASMAASGGYWIASTSDEIWAEPTTITGSIGIFGVIPTFENTLDKIGVHTDGVGTSQLAGAFDVSRPMSETAKDVVQQSIEEGYRQFLTRVAAGRGMSIEDVDKIAQGRVWAGSVAQTIGLVDNLGGLDDAIVAAAAKAGVTSYESVFYRDAPSNLDTIIADILDSLAVKAPVDDLSLISQSPMFKTAMMLKAEAMALVKFNDPMGRYALCLECSVR